MKKKVRQYAQQIQVGTQDRRNVLKDFSRMLDHQVYGTVALCLTSICRPEVFFSSQKKILKLWILLHYLECIWITGSSGVKGLQIQLHVVGLVVVSFFEVDLAMNK